MKISLPTNQGSYVQRIRDYLRLESAQHSESTHIWLFLRGRSSKKSSNINPQKATIEKSKPQSGASFCDVSNGGLGYFLVLSVGWQIDVQCHCNRQPIQRYATLLNTVYVGLRTQKPCDFSF